ncbi:MAG: hypothetical protein H6968_13610 [Chromatiaceae bacterium]|nr:hypothetical protein [Chromatiaceae bacterium]
MSNEQRRVADFQAQPEGPELLFRLTALSVVYLAQPNCSPFALQSKKALPAVAIRLVLTGPEYLISADTII